MYILFWLGDKLRLRFLRYLPASAFGVLGGRGLSPFVLAPGDLGPGDFTDPIGDFPGVFRSRSSIGRGNGLTL